MEELDLDFSNVDWDEIEDDEVELTDEQLEALIEEQGKRYDKSFDPVPYERKLIDKEIAVVDTETDPFAPNFLVKPFALGFRTSDRYVQFWGDDCVKQFFEYLATCNTQYVIYAHNGGKFDVFFFLDYLDAQNSPMIMNGRLVKVFFRGQEFRDSYAIIPESLEQANKKEKIDYDKFTRDNREKYRQEILTYMESDCEYLYELVTRFYDRFGDTLTIASASLRKLRSFHGFQQIYSESIDARFRQYYYGGRNQCFETGILKPSPGKQWLIVDRNSMYPSVMVDELHPISAGFELQDKIDDDTDFACIIADNNGALPMRAFNGSLDFTQKHGEFYATIHEIRAGLETGTLQIQRVKHAWKFERKTTFREFIISRYQMRQEEKDAEDIIGEKNTKREMNSSYGKFALNPRKFKQYKMTIGELPNGPMAPEYEFGWSMVSNFGDVYIWERPTPIKKGFYNVATAASITGAARANLLYNLSCSERPIYCDTDSIICETFHGDVDEKKLGGWKVEGIGDTAAIAGKKLYAIFNEREAIKQAAKGVRISADDIVELCNGSEIVFENPVPAFKLSGNHQFITRRIRMTG
jgi:hypothetical protein